MKADSGKTESIWTSTADVPQYDPLSESIQTNVCVIGAGIAGMTIAYTLAREGKSVVVLEDGQIGGGESGRTTAHLSNALDDRYTELEKMHGEKGARLAAQSHGAAIDYIENIVSTEDIACDFERLNGYLFVPPGTSSEILEQELEASHRAGLTSVRMVDHLPFLREAHKCLVYPGQGQFHPVKYLAGLAKAVTGLGGKIFLRTHAEEMTGGDPAHVTVRGGHKVTANAIVVATNSPVNDRVTMHTKQAPYRTYVIGALIPRGSVPTALYWDTLDPYHFVRLQALSEKHDVLIIGGEDHKTGQAHDTEERFGRLEEWGRIMFPMIDWIEFRWSGQVMEPVDSLGFIGHNPGDQKNVYIVTGDSGHGMTHGTIAGMLIPDLIQGRDNEWAKIYDPSRKTLRSVGEFAKENINVARQYIDLVTGGDVDSVDKIATEHGAVIRRGLQKIAIYRDEAGQLHERSAVCPHLGCIVDWNNTEKSWDCPCHGSRFNAYGKVVNGPANVDLSPADEDDPEPGVTPIPATPSETEMA